MRIDIRTAGLASQAEPRARLAAQLMAAFKFEARISAWDGTRCHVLIADADDAYGARCIEQAARRGISVLALSQGGSSGPETVSKTDASAPAAMLARQLAAMLEEKHKPSNPAMAGNGLVMLAMVPTLGSGIFAAQLNQHQIIINRQTAAVTLLGPLGSGLTNPHGVAFDHASNQMYVWDTGLKGLSILNRSTGAASVIGTTTVSGASNLLGLVCAVP